MKKEKKVIYRTLTENLDEGILACGYMPKPDQRSSQHHFTIQYYSCFVVLEGSGTYITEYGKQISIQKGDLVQRIPGICHSTEIDADGNWLEFFVSIGKPTYDMWKRLKLIPDSPVCHLHHSHAITYELDKLLERLEYVSERDLPTMLPELERTILNLFQRAKSNNNNHKLQQLEEASQILSSNLEKNLAMKDVADSIEMGYESFRKDFTKHFGLSPAKYRVKARMQQGVMMLLAGHSIIDCAISCGYSDVYAFSKQFTKTYGIAPGKYRKKEPESNE